MDEEELCTICFKAVGDKSLYKTICELGKSTKGVTVSVITKILGLTQPTITHHLNVLKSIDAAKVLSKGRERICSFDRKAHCFEDCKIPY